MTGSHVSRNVLVPMSDGVHLAADVYAPLHVHDLLGTGEGLPVVVEYLPYRKDDLVADERFYEPLLDADYLVVRVDVRGTGSSGGTSTDEYLTRETRDGHETVEWIAAQPWCDGHVNIMGFSYGGFTALQIAATRPPHLTSIIPGYFTDDRYTDDCHYVGGLMRLYYDVFYYGTFMVAFNALPPAADLGEAGTSVWQTHLDHNEPYLLEWLRHQTDSAYWRRGSVRDTVEDIACPVFMIAGWQDGYPNPPLRLLERLQVPHRLVVGPWNHATPDKAVPGPRIDFMREVVGWLDHWCRGGDPGPPEGPPVTVFVQESQRPVADRLDSAGTWRSEVTWPPPGASEEVLHLGDGVLEPAPGPPGRDRLVYVPTVGTASGLWSGGVPFGLPEEQSAEETHALLYSSAPLDHDLTVLGRGQVRLAVESSAPAIGFVVRLCDVAPDGCVQLVTKGALNATRRTSLSVPEPLVPGETYDLAIDLDATGWRFRAGHRLRLAVTNADWPNVWPTPYPATSHVARGSGNPSLLRLPVVPGEGSGPVPELAPSHHVPTPHREAATRPVWRVSREPLTGIHSVTLEMRSRNRVDERSLVERENWFVTTVDEADPAAASARGRHTSRLTRRDHTYVATSDVTVQAGVDRLDVTITLAVEVDGSLFFSRRWIESIPRELL